jgi:hypothetical protein
VAREVECVPADRAAAAWLFGAPLGRNQGEHLPAQPCRRVVVLGYEPLR